MQGGTQKGKCSVRKLLSGKGEYKNGRNTPMINICLKEKFRGRRKYYGWKLMGRKKIIWKMVLGKGKCFGRINIIPEEYAVLHHCLFFSNNISFVVFS